jgi:hypothetical protein
MIVRNFVTRLPVEEWRDPDDVGYTALSCLGVSLRLDPPCRIPEALNIKIEDALVAKAAAERANQPVALHHAVWLIRCKRCQAPFIGPSEARLCSDECRALAKRDSVRRASAKRSVSRSERNETRICRHCGRETQTARVTKRFCSVKCRVASHRGASAVIATLDRQIADKQHLHESLKKARAPSWLRRSVLESVMALQAERAKLA